jgi:hypothetical protein
VIPTNMKGKFNFLILLLRTIIIAIFLVFLCLLFKIFIRQDYDTSDSKGVTIILILILSYLEYCLVCLIIRQRFSFEVLERKFIVTDVLLRKTKEVDYNSIKGYSLGILKTKAYDWKEIVIYCNNGEIYQIPQYGFFNFKTLKTSITRNIKMKHLGEEKIDHTFESGLKSLIFRQYRFE